MNGICSKCGKHLAPDWAFCPHCAASVLHEVQTRVEPEHEPAPVRSAFSGLLLGLVAAPVLIISGGMICLTGLGVFLGVPLVIAGVCAPLVGSLLGLNALKGKCPWCGTGVSGVGFFNSFLCPACSKRITVRKNELLRAE